MVDARCAGICEEVFRALRSLGFRESEARRAVERAKRRDDYLFAVLFLDLDRFKVINDRLGHAVGDRLLVAVAKRLRAVLRRSDTVARLGGDEFAVLVPKLEIPDVIPPQLIRRLMGAFEQPYRIEGADVRVGTSLGIAIYPQHGEDTVTLFKNADSAMYHIKSDRKGSLGFFDPDIGQESAKKMRVEQQLRQLHRAVLQFVARAGHRRVRQDRHAGGTDLVMR